MPEIIGEITNVSILTGLIINGSMLWMILKVRIISKAQRLHIPSLKNDGWVKRRQNFNHP